MSQQDQSPILYIPLNLFLQELLGTEHHVEIEHKTASVIQSCKQYKEYCHIQYEDYYGDRLHYPVLWNLQKWRESVENYRLAKIKSEQQRVQWHCFQVNRESITRALKKRFKNLEQEHANVIADSWLRRGHHEALEELKITLKCTEEDLMKY